ncbi:MAG: hypothetical protein KGL39_43030 [Patescibacteria group bacterium]|nr:hypothetical protein [Patescibacteria group bacterium]
MAKKRTSEEKESAVKAWRFEIVNVSREQHLHWRSISDACRVIANRWWQLWETRHVAAGNVERLASFVSAHAAWKRYEQLNGEYQACLKRFRKLSASKKTPDRDQAPQAFRNYFAQAGLPLTDVVDAPAAPTKHEKPAKCDVPLMPDDSDGSIYTAISNSPLGKTINTRVIVLVLQRLQMRLTGKDSDGRWQLWQAVLLGRQSRPSAERDQPICLDKGNCTLPVLVSETKSKAIFECRVRMGREEVEGKKTCNSIYQTLRFTAEKSGLAIAKRIASGEYKMGGSQVFLKKGKWYVSFTYKMPGVEVERPGAQTAFLRPAKSRPWSFWRLGKRRSWRVGGRGLYVAAMRTRLVTRRLRESESYQWAGSARKGHGRRRAIGPVQVLQNVWRNFTTNVNRQLVANVVKECKACRIGKLVYFQPVDDARESRFLSTAGKVAGQREGTLWDWYQVGSLLALKCQEAGIELVVRKGREGMVKSTKTNKNDAVKGAA